MWDYLLATRRQVVAEQANRVNKEYGYLQADKGAPYDQVIEIDLSLVEPHISKELSSRWMIPL